MTIEYRLRPITRFVVTRYEGTPNTGSLKTIGEYDNKDVAYEIGYALAKAEADRLELPPGSMEVIFPQQLVATGLNLHQALGVAKIPDDHGNWAPADEVAAQFGEPPTTA